MSKRLQFYFNSLANCIKMPLKVDIFIVHNEKKNASNSFKIAFL